jgi:iron complex outermembrane receptor protein
MGGGANTHVLILRNGRPDFMGLMGCTIADEFSVDGVERIEVIRGPGSFMYGTNATGGIINLVPKKRTQTGFESRIRAGLGHFRSREVSASHGGKVGRFDYYVSMSNRKTDGHRNDGNSAYGSNQATLHLGYRTGKHSTLDLNANLTDALIHDPGTCYDPRENDWYDVLRFGGDINFVQHSRLGETTAKLHANFGQHEFFDGWQSVDRTLGFMVFHTAKPASGNVLTVGFDLKNYGGEGVDAVSSYGPFYLTECAPYIHVQQLFLRRFILSAGLRLEYHDLYSTELLPKAGIVIQPFSRTVLRFSIAKGFRSPSIRELYFWTPSNPDLGPDRVWNAEVGIAQSFGHRSRAEFVIFRSKGTNLIQLGGLPPRWMNTGFYDHTGFELTASWIPFEHMEIGGTWSELRLDESVYNTPRSKWTAFTHLHAGRFRFRADLTVVQNWRSAEFIGARVILHPMTDYMVANLTAELPLPHLFSLRIVLKNLFNTEYQAMYGYPMPGRHLLLNIIYEH